MNSICPECKGEGEPFKGSPSDQMRDDSCSISKHMYVLERRAASCVLDASWKSC